jgi:GNAT superfamily N-acetyltransferase
MLEISASSENKAKKESHLDLQISSTLTEIQSKNDDATTYYGIVKSRHNKIGEFLARVDWQSRVLFIEELFIERQYRGRGIGRKALNFLETKASSLKLREVVLEPFSSDSRDFPLERLRNWYRKQGYTSRRRSIFAPSTNLFTKAIW